MKELKFLNKFLFKYKIKLIIGFFITVTARIFALVAPNLVGNSITLIENYVLSSSIELEILKEKLLLNILLIYLKLFCVFLIFFKPESPPN